MSYDLKWLKSNNDALIIKMNSGKFRAMYTPYVLFGPFAGVTDPKECPYFFEGDSKEEVDSLVNNYLKLRKVNRRGEMMSTKETFVLTGRAFWAHVRKPSGMSGKYQLDLSIDEKTKEMLEAKGITVKNAVKGVGVDKKKPDDERGDFVTLSRGATTAEGEAMSPPKVIDAKKNIMDDNTLIGNGSKIKANVNIFDWTFKSKKGKSLGFNAIQVLELVEYKDSSLDVFSEEDGYTEETKATEDDDKCPF